MQQACSYPISSHQDGVNSASDMPGCGIKILSAKLVLTFDRSHSNSVSAVKRRKCANLTVEQKGSQKEEEKKPVSRTIHPIYLVAVLSTFDGFQPCNCQSFCQGN